MRNAGRNPKLIFSFRFVHPRYCNNNARLKNAVGCAVHFSLRYASRTAICPGQRRDTPWSRRPVCQRPEPAAVRQAGRERSPPTSGCWDLRPWDRRARYRDPAARPAPAHRQALLAIETLGLVQPSLRSMTCRTSDADPPTPAAERAGRRRRGAWPGSGPCYGPARLAPDVGLPSTFLFSNAFSGSTGAVSRNRAGARRLTMERRRPAACLRSTPSRPPSTSRSKSHAAHRRRVSRPEPRARPGDG
jgi:hypothetical protein